jgi:long-subunit acyl-CoA synthetase (AMP-forming)
MIGEIYIGGSGLALGYLGKPELTKDRFIPDPFCEGGRLYRTGDLGRWLPDGNMEFIGRKDDQVKIHGHRIELGEIAYALQAHPDVEAAVILAGRKPSGEQLLTAYVKAGLHVQSSALRAFLRRSLPAYMIPSNVVRVEHFPLTASGKPDREKLEKMESFFSETEYAVPRNEVEQRLASIWQELLEKERIGIKDNFFESGGHSIKVMKLVSRIHKEFGVKLRFDDVFNHATVEDLAKEIMRSNWAKEPMVDAYEKDLIEDKNFII